MDQLSIERKLELVELIKDIVQRSKLLESNTKTEKNVAKSIWGYFGKIVVVVERKYVGERERKERFFHYLRNLNARDVGVNRGDFKKAVSFVESQKLKSLTFGELKYVLSWIRRITEAE